MTNIIEEIEDAMQAIIKKGVDKSLIKKKILYYIIVIVLFTNIIETLKVDDHFVGLNKNTTFMDSVYYISITFSGWNYSNIYPQTSLGKTIILLLSLIKLYIIIGYPIKSYAFYKNEHEFYEIITKDNKKEAAEILAELSVSLQSLNNSK